MRSPSPPTLRYTRDDLEKALEGARTTTRDEVTEEVITKIVALVRRREASYRALGPNPDLDVPDVLDELAIDLQDGEWRRDA